VRGGLSLLPLPNFAGKYQFDDGQLNLIKDIETSAA